MAHNLTSRDSMFSVRETPWHGLGRVLPEAPSISEAIKLSGLDFEVELQPCYLADGRKLQTQAVLRKDTQAVLGEVGHKWTPVQNAHKFDWFQPFIEAGEAHLTTAGSLKGDRVTWIMAELGGRPLEIVRGDEVRKFILLSDSFDGSLAMRVGFTPQRVVCWNTLYAAHEAGTSKLIRMKHTSCIHANLELVRATMNVWNSSFEATAEQYRALARKDISPADVQKYVLEVFQPEADDMADLKTKGRNIVDKVVALSEMGRGNRNPMVAGTLWAAYNGVTQYLAYDYGHKQDTRLRSLWFGESAKLNKRALETALALAV